MFSDFVSDVNIAAWHSLPFGRFLQAWPQYKVATIKLNQELLQMHHVPLKEKRRHAWAVSFTHFCPNTSRWHTGADVRASTSMIRLSSPIMNWSWILILSLINHFDHLLIFSLFLSVLSRVDMMFFLRRRCSKFPLDFFWALSSVPLIHRLSACARFTRWSISQAPWMK